MKCQSVKRSCLENSKDNNRWQQVAEEIMLQEQQGEGEVGWGLEPLLLLRSWESGDLQTCVHSYHRLHSQNSCILANLAVHEPGKPAFLHTSLQQQRDRQQKAFLGNNNLIYKREEPGCTKGVAWVLTTLWKVLSIKCVFYEP